MILHYNWFCIDKRIDHLKWTSNNKNSYYTKELCSRFLHIHVLKNSRILYTFVRAYFAYLLLKNLRTVIVQKLQSVHWLLHVQINHDCIIIENIFNSCLWGIWWVNKYSGLKIWSVNNKSGWTCMWVNMHVGESYVGAQRDKDREIRSLPVTQHFFLILI